MFKLKFTDIADQQLEVIGKSSKKGLAKQLEKALEKLESSPRHPGLRTHKFSSMQGPNGEEIWQSYAQNNTPGAYRIFWHYGPDKKQITIIAITPHP